ncbi:MAG TPA: alpha/beta fold hydrolase [Cyclobacteriaceae bacterium]
MPVIRSTYKAPFYLFNGHAETILPSIFRKIKDTTYQRERFELSDGDFLDLDWLKTDSDRLVIISHGLEGNSERHYSKGMAKYFAAHQWDALAWNCRSCSGEMNRLPRFYHHGDALDLKAVVEYTVSKKYKTITLVGFSMGGSMTLTYLGQFAFSLPDAVKAAVTFSVPCDLVSSVEELNKPSRSFYRNRFLKKLAMKIEMKSKVFPELISYKNFDQIKTFEDFDNRYTAPLHGFKDASDFYIRASCQNHLSSIQVPALIVNAANDPFLTEPCYPKEMASVSTHIHLEIPKQGGHVGFSLFNSEANWMEFRAMEFISSVL